MHENARGLLFYSKTTLKLRLNVNETDFKTYAEANNLTAKENALEQLKEEVAWGVKKTGYNKTNIWE